MQSTLEQHQADYVDGAWRNYTLAELGSWVNLLAKRATHRKSTAKARKDLADARNYLAMMEARLSEIEANLP